MPSSSPSISPLAAQWLSVFRSLAGPPPLAHSRDGEWDYPGTSDRGPHLHRGPDCPWQEPSHCGGQQTKPQLQMRPCGPWGPELACFLCTFISFFSQPSFLPGWRVLFCLCFAFPAEGDATSPKPSFSPRAFQHALTFILTRILTLTPAREGWHPHLSAPRAHGHPGGQQNVFISLNQSKGRDLICGNC